MNTGAPWPDLQEAERRVRVMQTKLHQWATADPGRCFQWHEHMESRMQWKLHVRFGGRAGETHQPRRPEGRPGPTPTQSIPPGKRKVYCAVVLDVRRLLRAWAGGPSGPLIAPSTARRRSATPKKSSGSDQRPRVSISGANAEQRRGGFT